MKRINITTIAFVLLSAVALTVAGVFFNASVYYIMLGFFAVVSIGIVVCLFNFLFGQKQEPIVEEKSEPQEVARQEAPVTDIAEDKAAEDKTRGWSKAMYDKYTPMWDDLFEKIKYPASQQQKAMINILCWEVASRTIDFLRVDNDDANVLERNRRSVEDTVNGTPDGNRQLKKFYVDPTTVPAKVIAVHSALTDSMTDDMTGNTTVFGYSVNLKKKDE